MDITLWQAILVMVVAFIYNIDRNGMQWTTYMAVFWGTIVGVILGDPAMGMQIGATSQLMSLGVAALGGASMPDYQLVAIVATVVSIATGQDQGVGLAVGVAVGMVSVQLDVIIKILGSFVARRAQAYMRAGKFDAMTRVMWIGPVMYGMVGAIPTFIMLAFGTDAVNFVLEVMPAWFTTGLSIAGGALPVVGMAMLLVFMPTKKYISFVIVGYVLAAYVGLSILPVALLGAAAAYESYKRLTSQQESLVASNEGVLEDE